MSWVNNLARLQFKVEKKKLSKYGVANTLEKNPTGLVLLNLDHPGATAQERSSWESRVLKMVAF